MSEPFIGQICMFGFNFAPRNWARCDGQLLTISQNSALYALLGITYGGNGTINFALPDLRGRVPMHAGQGPGLTNRIQGQAQGTETVTLTTAEIPAHVHSITPNAVDTVGTSTSPNNGIFAVPASNRAIYDDTATGTPIMKPIPSSPVGGSLPHSNMQPYLVIEFCICLYGIFPSRN